MSFLKLNGTVLGVYETPAGTDKDGKEYGGKWRVELLCKEILRNGHTRHQMFSLNTNNRKRYEDSEGQEVDVPVGVFVTPKGVQFYEVK